MTTQLVTLTAEPVQLTNGSETAYISSKFEFLIADSDSKPDKSAGHSEKKITVNPPFQMWAWKPEWILDDMAITVSKRISS